MNIFGNIVKHYLIDNNVTQKSISDKIGASKNAINNLLNRDNISLDKMLLIADALNCELKIELVPKDGGNASEDIGD